MTSQAEHLRALRLFPSKNAFCAETLSRPTIAVKNNRFMASQHDSSFNTAHSPCPGLHFESVIGSSATHQKSLTTHNYYCITIKFLEIALSKLDSIEKHDSNFGNLCMKKIESFQKERFSFFLQSSMGRGFYPQTSPPRAYVHAYWFYSRQRL